MKAEVKDGRLCISAENAIRALDEKSLRELARYAVFQETLLDGVVGALVEGRMWGDDEEPAWWYGGDTFTKLRLKLLPLLPAVTAEAVREIERAARQAKENERRMHDGAWELWRAWPTRPHPDAPGGEFRYQEPMTREQAAEHLRGVEAKLAAEKPEVERLRGLLRTAIEHGHRLAGLECCAEDEDRFEALAKEAGLDMTFPHAVTAVVRG